MVLDVACPFLALLTLSSGLPWKRKQVCSQGVITRRKGCQSPAWPLCVVSELLGGAFDKGGQQLGR